MLDKLLGDLAEVLPDFMRHKYANHVLQRMIDFSDDEQAQQLRDAMLPHAEVLNEQVCACGGPWGGVGMWRGGWRRRGKGPVRSLSRH